MVQRPPDVARCAFRNTVRRTPRAGLGHAIIACASVHCANTVQAGVQIRFQFCAHAHVRIHFVPSSLIVQPVLHNAHLAAPSTGHFRPVCARPFLHVHVFPTEIRYEKVHNQLRICRLDCFMKIRTNTLSFVVVDSKTGVACLALCSAIHRTIRGSLCYAVLARARIS